MGRPNWVGYQWCVGLVLCWILAVCPKANAQEADIPQLEKDYKNLFGLEKLKALNKISAYYYDRSAKKAQKYARQAVTLSENIFVESNSIIDFKERHEQAFAYIMLGKILFDRKVYFDAQDNLQAGKVLSDSIEHVAYANEAAYYLQKIQDLIDAGKIKESFFSKTFGDLKVGEAINSTSKDLTIQTEIKLGKSREKKGDYQGAIDHYEKVINLLRNKGDAEGIKAYQIKIAVLLDSLNDHVQAQKFLNEALTAISSDTTEEMAMEKLETKSYPTDRQTAEQDSINTALIADQNKLKTFKQLADEYALEKDFEKSLAYEKRYHELARKMETDSLRTVAESSRAERDILLLKQQKRIADLNVNEIEKEKERQVKYRNILMLVAFLILSSTVVVYKSYSAKKKEHKKLTITHQDLQKTKGKLEDAEQKIVQMLKQQVSGDIAQELIQQGTQDLQSRCFVCVMFLDIRNFTATAEKLSPEELIAYQNEMFGFMIDAVQEHHGNINQLLGDGFMATFGAPVSHGNDCENAYQASLQILEELKVRGEAGIIPKIKIGIGLHAGFVVTGNVGNESRKQYSVTGNPVILASRLEQMNKTYKTQLVLSEEVHERLAPNSQPSASFRSVQVKGRTEPINIMAFE